MKIEFEIDISYKRIILIIEIGNKKMTKMLQYWQKNIILKNIRRNKIENYFQDADFSNISYNRKVNNSCKLKEIFLLL